MSSSLRVLHLNTEKSWRGGENQVRLLIDGLQSKVEYQCGVVPSGSPTFLEKKWNCELFSLASSSPLDPRNIFKLIQICKKQKIQIIDAHSAGAHSLALKALTFLPEVKLVVHRRVDNVPKSTFFTKRKYFSNRVQAYIAISKAIAGILKEYGIPEEKLRVARSAYSLTESSISKEEAQAQLRKNHSLDANTVLIGNASAFSPQKGYETLIDAVKILKTRKLKFHVLIAGSGKLEESLHQRVEALDLKSHITFLGFIQDVHFFLLGLDILAVPSRWEGLGTILLDGASAGCALVGSKVGGIPEIIDNEMSGLLIEKENPEQLAKALERLILNPQSRLIMSHNAKLKVSTEFSPETMVNNNLEIYRSL